MFLPFGTELFLDCLFQGVDLSLHLHFVLIWCFGKSGIQGCNIKDAHCSPKSLRKAADIKYLHQNLLVDKQDLCILNVLILGETLKGMECNSARLRSEKIIISYLFVANMWRVKENPYKSWIHWGYVWSVDIIKAAVRKTIFNQYIKIFHRHPLH